MATDKILPYFMSQTFPRGVVGLVIASIMASSLSSVDSAINSCTSVIVVDFYNRLVLNRQTGHRASQADDRHEVLISRIATVAFGGLGTLLATNVSRIGSLLEIANKLINAFTGPLFGIYLLAMFSRRAASGGTLAAGLIGTVTSYYVAYHTPIGFMWPSTFGLAATLVTGWILSVVLPSRPTPEALRLTWSQVMQQRVES
jgi:Na+/proline symporter